MMGFKRACSQACRNRPLQPASQPSPAPAPSPNPVPASGPLRALLSAWHPLPRLRHSPQVFTKRSLTGEAFSCFIPDFNTLPRIPCPLLSVFTRSSACPYTRYLLMYLR